MQYPEDDVRNPKYHRANVNARLNTIETEIRLMFKIVSENHLALMKIEKRIAVMQEKIDGID